MTEAKHTPGPWVHDGNAVYFLDWDGRTYEGGKPFLSNRWFCSLQGQTWVSGTGNPPRCSEGELEANARLIAAAPDMLEALKAARTLLTALNGGHPRERASETMADELALAIFDAADAAIAKAMGEA